MKDEYRKAMEWWEENQGKKARDKVTGFEGTITGFALHLTGCNTVGLTPPVDKDGKMSSGQYFDVGRLDVLNRPPTVTSEEVKSEKKGCGDNPTSTTHNP